MINITVVELKAIGKQPGIKGYYHLRKAELINKLEAPPDVDEQVLVRKNFPTKNERHYRYRTESYRKTACY